MNQTIMMRDRRAGFTMIEVLVSLLIIVLGLLGLAGLQARMHQAELESYQRAQALILLYDIVDRINYNRATASCFAITTNANGTPYYGEGSSPLPACGASIVAHQAMANAAMAEWDNTLKGAAETKGGVSVGAMLGARGCVSYDATTELVDSLGATISGTGVYTVAVAWQGSADTAAPTRIDDLGVAVPVNCGNNLYGAETKRRAVTTTFRLAKLS
jgi:type IV pilus assembly protein PilV